jgi:hypothetical protein
MEVGIRASVKIRPKKLFDTALEMYPTEADTSYSMPFPGTTLRVICVLKIVAKAYNKRN